VDTSVIWQGPANPHATPGRVIDRWYGGSEFTLIWTDDILEEYWRKLLSAEYLDSYGKQMEVEEFPTLVEIFGEHVLILTSRNGPL